MRLHNASKLGLSVSWGSGLRRPRTFLKKGSWNSKNFTTRDYGGRERTGGTAEGITVGPCPLVYLENGGRACSRRGSRRGETPMGPSSASRRCRWSAPSPRGRSPSKLGKDTRKPRSFTSMGLGPHGGIRVPPALRVAPPIIAFFKVFGNPKPFFQKWG